jgi:hypothetical protein
MIVQTLEAAQSSTPKGIKSIKAIFLVLAALLLIKIIWFSGLTQGANPRPIVDFDAFYVAAQMVWRGEIEQAYHFTTMVQAQKALTGSQSFMPWTYPPQFDLLVAPLALLPLGVAYGLFTAGTLVAYLATLRRIAGENFPLVLVVLFPAIAVMIACGQNGFLTGTLIGLTCLGIQKQRPLAGLPLGLMVIKPHLAVAFAVYTLVTRRWGAAMIAAATVVATSALTTILLGFGVWAAALGGAKEARLFLEHGMYPLFRMVSLYAALYTFGFPATFAIAAQALIAVVSLAMVCLTVRRGIPLRQSLGLTAIASLLISPYAYDYDLPIYGIGLALLLPDLMRLGSKIERAVLYGLSFFTGIFGLAQSLRLQMQAAANPVIDENNIPLSVAGLTLLALLGLAWRILRRDQKDRVKTGEVIRAKDAILGVGA